MGEDQKPAWVEFLDSGVIGKDISGTGMLYAVTFKLDASGVLAVLKAKGGGGYLVCFVGAGTLKQCVGKMRAVLSGDSGKWREDKYH